MSSDGAYPPHERFNYKNCFDAIKRISKEEGFGALWIGWKPAALRCMILNVTQITLYKNSKIYMLDSGLIFSFAFLPFPSRHRILEFSFFSSTFSGYFRDNATLYVICSIWTAFVSSVATAPIDIIKTRQVTTCFSKKFNLYYYFHNLFRTIFF